LNATGRIDFREKATVVKADLTVFVCRLGRPRRRPGGSAMSPTLTGRRMAVVAYCSPVFPEMPAYTTDQRGSRGRPLRDVERVKGRPDAWEGAHGASCHKELLINVPAPFSTSARTPAGRVHSTGKARRSFSAGSRRRSQTDASGSFAPPSNGRNRGGPRGAEMSNGRKPEMPKTGPRI
jgi:hypothetical protein